MVLRASAYLRWAQAAWIIGRHEPGEILTVLDRRKIDSTTEIPNNMSGSKILGLIIPLPQSIRVDHGTEFTSRALGEWAWQLSATIDYIRPGKPTENGMTESFNSCLRDEWLNYNEFESLRDARAQIEAW